MRVRLSANIAPRKECQWFIRDDETALTADIIRLASEYDRYGYRWITTILRREGCTVNLKQVERI